MNAILIVALMAVPGQAAPLMSDPPMAERGQVRGGPVLHQRFTLTNKGQSTLAIVEARASCGCLSPKLAARSLKSGEATTLDLDISTISQPDGDNLWSVRLLYQVEGADMPVPMDLRVTATLVREVGVNPAALRLIGSPTLSHEITLTDRRAKPFEVIAVRSAAGKIAADAGPWQQVEGKWERKIRVHIAEDCPVGKFDEALVIYGNDPDYRELRVTVNGERRGKQRYQVAPLAVVLEYTAGKPTPEAVVLVRDREGQPVEVERVESDDPALRCRVADASGPIAKLFVGVAGDRTPARSSNLTIHVKAPVAQTVVVPVGIQE